MGLGMLMPPGPTCSHLCQLYRKRHSSIFQFIEDKVLFAVTQRGADSRAYLRMGRLSEYYYYYYYYYHLLLQLT